ncbi:ABC transporter permease [Natrarchaeobius chitinivorans]|uniref:ABC transporter permease n=1 Tax=Natrarchaeobius chitinivorans TaxID=1679083 RepID=A0A3N6MIH3_NATCH|nr:ABC transporter permease [Natrarchaeobius chitinivorans]RQG95461.1 ABC transporter permease [Natrarchaeobius chitinivorans]
MSHEKPPTGRFQGVVQYTQTVWNDSIALDRIRETTTHRKGQLGFLTVVGIALLAVFAPIVAPHDPQAIDGTPFIAPGMTGEHILGTDSYGRDIFSRLLYGGRISLVIGIGATGVAAVVGTIIGVISGYYGGLVDDVLMRFIDALWALPWLVLAILIISIFGRSITNVILIISIAYIDDFARIGRGEVLAIREEEYILAAKNIGLGDLSIMSGTVLPNMVGPIIVQFTIFTARAILVESALSFLGLGVSPATPTWGMMLGDGRDYIMDAWHIAILPGLAIVITTLGINLYGDALRDSFDVKQTRED